MPDETLKRLMSIQDKIAVAMHRIMSEPGHDVSVAATLLLANRELLNAIKAAGGKLA